MEQQLHPDSGKEVNGDPEILPEEDRTERFLKRLDIQHKVLRRLLESPTDSENGADEPGQPE